MHYLCVSQKPLAKHVRMSMMPYSLPPPHPGKTCLMDRFVSDQFHSQYQRTSSAGFAAKKMTLADGRVLRVGLWDTAGDATFASLTRAYLQGVQAGIVCVCLESPASYHRAKAWASQLQEASGGSVVHA